MNTTDTVFFDPTLPDPGSGFTYLMAIVDGDGTQSFLGVTSAGTPRQVDPSCP